MKLGTMVDLRPDDLEARFRFLSEAGMPSCQVSCWHQEQMTPENARLLVGLSERYAVEVSAFWCGWDGPCEWNLIHGPATIGLVPTAYRHKRLDTLLAGSRFCELIGVSDLVTHVGFIPNDPADERYAGLVGALRYLARAIRPKGQHFLFETGQEAPVTLLRTIEDIGLDNVGVNLDPANLLMYGMGNPIDALSVFGHLVRNVHAKDGVCPPNGRDLGAETPIGKGMVNFPVLVARLKEIGYDRFLTIEREIGGEEQLRDIRASKVYLESLIADDGAGAGGCG